MYHTTYSGEIAALLVAFFWTITALSFEVAAKRIGSLAVNLLRLAFAMVFLSVFTWIYRGYFLPTDASSHAWIWLGMSGFVGFVFGDYFLIKSYTLIPSRISMLVMTFVPPVTAILGWIVLGEVMTLKHLLGMMLTVGGIFITIFSRNRENGKVRLHYPIKGIIYAFFGVLGQAGGLILSKYGMHEYDPFSSTQIRIIAGLIGFGLIIVLTKNTGLIKNAFSDRKAIATTLNGSFFGPFLGVSFSLIAIQHTGTGIASTLMAIVPILIIPPSALLLKQKVGLIDYFGATISVSGLVLFFV